MPHECPTPRSASAAAAFVLSVLAFVAAPAHGSDCAMYRHKIDVLATAVGHDAMDRALEETIAAAERVQTVTGTRPGSQDVHPRVARIVPRDASRGRYVLAPRPARGGIPNRIGTGRCRATVRRHRPRDGCEPQSSRHLLRAYSLPALLRLSGRGANRGGGEAIGADDDRRPDHQFNSGLADPLSAPRICAPGTLLGIASGRVIAPPA